MCSGESPRPSAAQKPAPRAALAPGNPVQQPDARQPADEREEPRREDAVAQQPHEHADEGEVQWAVLKRFQESVPEMGIGRPLFGELDAHRRVPVVLVPVREGRGPREGGDREQDQQIALQAFR